MNPTGSDPSVGGARATGRTLAERDDERRRLAARALLARDGADLVLRPWQAGYLIALAEGRPAEVPLACGLGRGWLQERLDEALAALAGEDAPGG